MAEILEYLRETGIANLVWGNIVLLLVGLAFLYVAVARKMEPYVLLPIGLGIILANLPLTGLAEFDPSGSVLRPYTMTSCNLTTMAPPMTKTFASTPGRRGALRRRTT